MKRLHKIEYLRLYVIELAVILCVFSAVEVMIYENDREAIERGERIMCYPEFSKQSIGEAQEKKGINNKASDYLNKAKTAKIIK